MNAFALVGYFSAILIALGIPVDDWPGCAVVVCAMAFAIAGTITSDYRRWFAILILSAAAVTVRVLLPAPVIHEGIGIFVGKGDLGVYRAGLPPEVFARHLAAWEKNWSKKPHTNLSSNGRLFDRSIYTLLAPSYLSRRTDSIDFVTRGGLRFDGFNDASLNVYGADRPRRDELPYYIRWNIGENSRQGASLCWQGEIFIPTAEGTLQNVIHRQRACRPLDGLPTQSGILTLWAVNADPDLPLSVKFEPRSSLEAARYLSLALSLLAGIAIIGLAVRRPNLKMAAAVIAAFGLTVLSMIIHRPDTMSGFSLFEGGNDGLVHFSLGRDILFALMDGNIRPALVGGESSFDFQPGYRYLHAVLTPLFGATIFGPLLLTALVPIVIFRLMKQILGERWALVLSVMFFFVPVFEAFGFWQHYFAYQMLRGFAEPVAYLLFFLGIARCLPLFTGGPNSREAAPGAMAWTGLGLAAAIMLRVNLIPGVLVLAAAVGIVLLQNRRFPTLAALAMTLSLVFLIPAHNLAFGEGKFVLLTVSATRPFNMGASPSDWFSAAGALLRGDFTAPSVGIVAKHLNGEIPLRQPWYHLALAVCLYMAFRKATSAHVRLVAFTALALQVQLLFYRVGGRYGYAAWILTLLVFLAWVREVALPAWRHRRERISREITT